MKSVTVPSASHSSTQGFIHIDEPLRASRWQIWLWGGVAGMVSLMLALLPLPILERGTLIFLAIACVLLSYLIRTPILAISTLTVPPLQVAKRLAAIQSDDPPIHLLLNNIEWQLAIRPSGFANVPSQLWQGYILAANGAGGMLSLTFLIIEPQVQQVSLSIWQDQCDPDIWRQLRTLSH